ncbi:MAG: glycosyltransferase family 4 protein [Chloroflexi bacterium]|uniref:Glycosyltransferase family 4 protein n=1 Tax=Candidatus Chlorohelix allophototropha TaxID=3003348 RepID=A0A8T7M3S8_9CHLR|nr:glycosyltransferase family 4 protein [Chloroflexota bacterium]WJW66105.1 glycosyltransferase family 4 protein [Chloroflexota bacterium L227-S17]
MKILTVTKAALGVGQRKLEELAAIPGVEQLTLIVPPYWEEPRVGRTYLEKLYTSGYELIVEPMTLNGNFHLHFYPGLGKWIKRLRPDIVFMEEESFNLATAHGSWLAEKYGAVSVFFNWANTYREYPPPFKNFESYNFKHTAGALAGNDEARALLRRRGYAGALAVCPQFGVDTTLFQRCEPPTGFKKPGVFTVGYIGRLVPEKGLVTPVEACARLKGDFRLVYIGAGPQKAVIEEAAQRLGIAQKVEFIPAVSSIEIPAYMSGLDALVLPSLTTSNWKEQFGRVLVEAMACETPVVGSSSGEIPYVIGDAGLVFPEGSALALAENLQKLMDDSTLRTELAQRGLERVNANYTQAQVARRHYDLFAQALNTSKNK